jgi:hypothetical protein
MILEQPSMEQLTKSQILIFRVFLLKHFVFDDIKATICFVDLSQDPTAAKQKSFPLSPNNFMTQTFT